MTLTGTDGSTYTLQPSWRHPNGQPGRDYNLHCNCDRKGGKSPATATVTVMAPQLHRRSPSSPPPHRLPGGLVHVDGYRDECEPGDGDRPDGTSYNLQPSGGTQAVSPAANTTYTATATGAGGKVSATTTVTVTAPIAPPTVSITANPTPIASGKLIHPDRDGGQRHPTDGGRDRRQHV